ncbi:MAG: DUF3592 domain-containing protein [Chloroflexi bacterium]|nr:MAG: DUF3592 domain-containing protein [Chloroflexota bacterium]
MGKRPFLTYQTLNTLPGATGIVCLFLAIIVAAIVVFQTKHQTHLRENGIEVNATITDKRIMQVSSGRGYRTDYQISVMYFDDPLAELGEDAPTEVWDLGMGIEIEMPVIEIGDFHSDDISITEERYHSLRDGGDLAVLYLPEKRDEAWVADAVYNYSARGGWVVTTIFILLAGLFLFIAIRKNTKAEKP